jgi:hypothetical protein
MPERPADIAELRARQRKRMAAIRKLNARYVGRPFPRRAAETWNGSFASWTRQRSSSLSSEPDARRMAETDRLRLARPGRRVAPAVSAVSVAAVDAAAAPPRTTWRRRLV